MVISHCNNFVSWHKFYPLSTFDWWWPPSLPIDAFNLLPLLISNGTFAYFYYTFDRVFFRALFFVNQIYIFPLIWNPSTMLRYSVYTNLLTSLCLWIMFITFKFTNVICEATITCLFFSCPNNTSTKQNSRFRVTMCFHKGWFYQFLVAQTKSVVDVKYSLTYCKDGTLVI